MRDNPKYCLTDDDIRFEYRVMQRWCRMFGKTALDWVNLEAKRFRDRHPVIQLDPEHYRAA